MEFIILIIFIVFVCKKISESNEAERWRLATEEKERKRKEEERKRKAEEEARFRENRLRHRKEEKNKLVKELQDHKAYLGTKGEIGSRLCIRGEYEEEDLKNLNFQDGSVTFRSKHSDLTDTNFQSTHAELYSDDSIFRNTNFQKANVSMCRMVNSNFENANFELATIYLGEWGDGYGYKLMNNNFTNANFELVDIRIKDKSYQITRNDVGRNDFSNANFHLAKVSKNVLLRGSKFINANFEGATLAEVILCGCDFKGANLRNADLRGADLARANFKGADLRGAKLDYVKDANFEGAILKDSDVLNQ